MTANMKTSCRRVLDRFAVTTKSTTVDYPRRGHPPHRLQIDTSGQLTKCQEPKGFILATDDQTFLNKLKFREKMTTRRDVLKGIGAGFISLVFGKSLHARNTKENKECVNTILGPHYVGRLNDNYSGTLFGNDTPKLVLYSRSFVNTEPEITAAMALRYFSEESSIDNLWANIDTSSEFRNHGISIIPSFALYIPSENHEGPWDIYTGNFEKVRDTANNLEKWVVMATEKDHKQYRAMKYNNSNELTRI